MKWNMLMVVGALVVGGCANGGVSVGELAFAGRVALVLSAEEEPTAEEIRSLVEAALRIAESRGVEPANLEYAQVLAGVVIDVLESEGDWRAELADLLESIEGEHE